MFFHLTSSIKFLAPFKKMWYSYAVKMSTNLEILGKKLEFESSREILNKFQFLKTDFPYTDY